MDNINELMMFDYDSKEIRSILIDGEPWFVGKDVSEVLGYSNHSKCLIDHVDDEDKLNNESLSSLGQRGGWLINESGLYSLVISSKLPNAKQFKRWITKEVLPSIRKNGIYATEVTVEKMLSDPDFAISLLTKLKEERKARVEAERTNAILMHVNKTYTSTELAKEIGLKSAIALNKILVEKDIQFKQNGTWVLYSKYANCGYTEIKQSALDNGKVVYDRRWTQLGRDFILKTLEIKEGI